MALQVDIRVPVGLPLPQTADFIAECEAADKLLEAQRLRMRTNDDREMMREIGFCSGIENDARHIDGRQAGESTDEAVVVSDRGYFDAERVVATLGAIGTPARRAVEATRLRVIGVHPTAPRSRTRRRADGRAPRPTAPAPRRDPTDPGRR